MMGNLKSYPAMKNSDVPCVEDVPLCGVRRYPRQYRGSDSSKGVEVSRTLNELNSTSAEAVMPKSKKSVTLRTDEEIRRIMLRYFTTAIKTPRA